MELTPKTRINELVERYPFLVDFLAAYNPKFALLKKRTFSMTLGRVATLRRASTMGNVPLGDLARAIQEEIRRQTGEHVAIEVGEHDDPAARRAALKKIIEDLHKGLDPAAAKERFNRIIQDIDPSEIAEMEQALIKEGLPIGEIQRLCDVHAEVMKDDLQDQETPQVEPGHPVHTYMAENDALAAVCERLNGAAMKLPASPAPAELAAVERALEELAKVETHYVRKENQLFPFLERHDITGPPKVMWGVHDEIRGQIREARAALGGREIERLKDATARLTHSIVEMVFKENKILFPMALGILSEDEWAAIRAGEDTIGYIFVTPGTEWRPALAAAAARETRGGDTVKLDVGALTPEQLNAMLMALPVDISFVDDKDTVRYYNECKDRLFPRSPGVIGRAVQNCHPPKSVHMVDRILEEFRAGRKDVAEFWMTLKGRFLHIRYLAVRDGAGKYLGTVEMAQDVTEIRALEGERKLLDWE